MCSLLLSMLAVPCAQAQDSTGQLCQDYPQFCVPRVGRVGAPAAPGSWQAARAVRGMTPDGYFFIGDPAAPAQFMLFYSFTCMHCSGYYKIELLSFIQDYVLSGQAALRVAILSFSMQPYSDNAALGAICAGEQGAFWEMQHELLYRGSADGPTVAFELQAIEALARALGLDAERLMTCIQTGQYRFLLDRYRMMALDAGVSATPTLLFRLADSSSWQKTARSYSNLAQIVADAER
jgi:protein-disulfide isomerase